MSTNSNTSNSPASKPTETPKQTLEAKIREIETDFGSKVYRLAVEQKGFDNKYPEVTEVVAAIITAFESYRKALDERDKWFEVKPSKPTLGGPAKRIDHE